MVDLDEFDTPEPDKMDLYSVIIVLIILKNLNLRKLKTSVYFVKPEMRTLQVYVVFATISLSLKLFIL